MRLGSRIRYLSRPMTRTCRCLSPADRRSTSVRRALTLAFSGVKKRFAPQSSSPGSIAFPHQLGELALEPGHSTFELVHPVTNRSDLALNKLPRAVANALIDLCRGLLQRFSGESIVEHLSSSGAGSKGTR